MSKQIAIIKSRQVGQTHLANQWAMGIDPFADKKLIPPYVIGDGRDFSDVVIFLECTSAHASGDIITTPGNQQLIVDSVEHVEDFFEAYTAITVRIVTKSATTPIDPLLAKQRVISKMGSGLWQQLQKGSNVYDPTKVINVLPSFLKDTAHERKTEIQIITGEKGAEQLRKATEHLAKVESKAKGKVSASTLFSPVSRMGDYFTGKRRKGKVQSERRRSRRRK